MWFYTLSWRTELISDLKELVEDINQVDIVSIIAVKSRMDAIYNKLPATIGTPKNDDTKFRLEICEEKINKIVLWIREARQI